MFKHFIINVFNHFMENLFLLLFFISIISLIIGLIKPNIFARFINGEISRKKIGVIFSIATVASFILFGIATDSTKNDTTAIPQPILKDNQKIIEDMRDNNNALTKKEEVLPLPAKTDIKANTTPTQPPLSSETISQKNAVRKAKSYLDYSAFSHDGLVAQLEYEQFSNSDAIYGADNSGANWNEQAAAKAKSYMSYSAFSRGGLIAQLKYDKFTQTQAEFGANAVGL